MRKCPVVLSIHAVRSHSFTQQWQQDTFFLQGEGCLLFVMILTGKTLHRDCHIYKAIFTECLHRFQHWDELYACIPSFPFLGEAEPSSPRLAEAGWGNTGQGQRSCMLALSSPLTTVHTHLGFTELIHTFSHGESQGHAC